MLHRTLYNMLDIFYNLLYNQVFYNLCITCWDIYNKYIWAILMGILVYKYLCLPRPHIHICASLC